MNAKKSSYADYNCGVQLLKLCLLISYSSSFIITTITKIPGCNQNINQLVSTVATASTKFSYYDHNHKFTREISLSLASSNTDNIKQEVDLEKLKSDLNEYLRVREEMLNNGTYERKLQKGKVVGGTKGNVVLDWVSASPSKPIVIDEERNVFDYEELAEFGFSDLVSPIMDAGGRKEMYKLMNMTKPSLPERLKPKKARKVVIDRSGETDQARYKGLKITQVIDDNEMARALENANKRSKEEGTTKLRPKIQEEMYEIPFSDSVNVGPKWTPNWTAEQLDEEGKKRGQAIAWARKAKEGQFVTDPYESLLIENEQRLYAILASIFITIAYGKSTTPFLTSIVGLDISNVQSTLELLQYPALVIVLAAIGSCGANWTIAREKKRSGIVWAIKGFMGGPASIMQLRNLNDLELEVLE